MYPGSQKDARHAEANAIFRDLLRAAQPALDPVREPDRLAAGLERGVARAGEDLKVKNGRKNVKSAPYRPILSANRTGRRPTAVDAHADPAQNGGNGGN